MEAPPQEARRILEIAKDREVTLRLIGGVAVNLRCPSSRQTPLGRNYVDIDFVGHRKQSRELRLLFPTLGYSPREVFNALHGHTRLVFNDLPRERRVDIFLDDFEMCHKLDFTDRLELEELTLPLADLLATKLQIVEMNEKDMKDILSILLDNDVATNDSPESIDGAYLAKLCSDDWGIHRTFILNLAKISNGIGSFGLSDGQVGLVQRRISELQRLIDEHPKSLRWKVRASVGERVRWYELPTADTGVVDS